VAFVDRLGSLQVKVDMPAIVVINERTGTIVVGENVGISTVAISHGNLSIITQEKDFVSQPQPFSRAGTTEKTQRTEITAVEGAGTLHVVPRQVSVAELARALNAMGLTPRDLISIFEALRQAGALQAQLKVI
jgi:flagellar P-ring protein precursor FlgI